MAGDIQSQEDELLALASIYSNKEIFSTSTDGDQRSGYFSAMLTLPDDFEIKASKKGESSICIFTGINIFSWICRSHKYDSPVSNEHIHLWMLCVHVHTNTHTHTHIYIYIHIYN